MGSLVLCHFFDHGVAHTFLQLCVTQYSSTQEVQVTTVESDFTEFYRSLRRHERRINESGKQ